MSGRRGLAMPLILIVLGVVFLLANLGYLPGASVAALARLWPLLLVLAGIDIALARRAPLLALALEVLVLFAGIAFAFLQPALPQLAGGQTRVVAERRAQDASLDLQVDGGAGRYAISGGSGALVEATADQPGLRIRTTRSGTRADVRLDQRADGQLGFAAPPIDVRVGVAGDIPTSLDLNGGAGDFTLDLSSMRVTGARINVGAAQLRLVLPRPTGEVAISVSAGASSIVVEIPADVEARVTLSGALTTLSSANARFSGDATGGYATAADRVTVRITGGASSVAVR